jgi:hypothetical protein
MKRKKKIHTIYSGTSPLSFEISRQISTERRWVSLLAIAGIVTQTSGLIAILYFVESDILRDIKGEHSWSFWVTLIGFSVSFFGNFFNLKKHLFEIDKKSFEIQKGFDSFENNSNRFEVARHASHNRDGALK